MSSLWFKIQVLWYYWVFRSRKFASRSALLHWQQRQLQQYERFLRKRSPFYAQKMQQYGTIDALPPVNKAAFMAHFDQINTLGITLKQASEVALRAESERDFSPTLNGVTVGLSSGTTGHRGVFLVSPRERAQWVGAVLAHVIGLSLRRRRVAFFLRSGSQLYASVQSSLLAFQYYDLSRSFDQLLEELTDQQPHILVAQPAVLERIASFIEQRGDCWVLEKVVSVAEVLEKDTKIRLERVFGVQVGEVYQCTEGFLASSCAAGHLHFHEGMIRVEPRWLDDSETRFYPIITDFTRQSQPVVRYELNDIVHLLPHPCPCGQCTLAIDHIEGRQDDMLLFARRDDQQPVLVFPDFIRRIFIVQEVAADLLEQYQVVQDETAHLTVFLQIKNSEMFSDISTAIIRQFEQYCANNELIVPEINIYEGISYRYMEKFRRVKRLFPVPDQTPFL